VGIANSTGRLLRGDKGRKAIVVGAVERKGRVIARTATDTTGKTLKGFVKEYVPPRAPCLR